MSIPTTIFTFTYALLHHPQTFSHSNCSNWRMREDNSWDVAVVQLRVWLIVKETVSKLATGSDGDWRNKECVHIILESYV